MADAGSRPGAKLQPDHGECATEGEALRAIVDRLVRAFQPRAIYLFGSRAEGQPRGDSDFDLLVVSDDDDPRAPLDDVAVYAPLVGLGIGCDVLACRTSEFAAVMADPSNPWRGTWSRARKVHERAA